MKIAVASGKGGTGKTTVATNLAVIARDSRNKEHDILFLDCDVEEPNAALFLKPVIHNREEVGIMVPEVNEDICTYCRRCSEVCVWHAIAVLPENILLFPQLCHGCGSCTHICPVNAVSETLNVTGIIESGAAGSISFAHGILNVGEVMAPPVIRELKKNHPSSIDSITIIDASPGTSCPVVESIKDADFVLLVTEPTPFGMHDLKLAVQLARDELKLPVGIVINRDGIGDNSVDDFSAKENIPVLGRIPFDRRIAEIISNGQLVIESLPEYRSHFEDIFRGIETVVKT